MKIFFCFVVGLNLVFIPIALAKSGEDFARVKNALSTCQMESFFEVKSTITDADPETRVSLAQFFLDRLKAKDKCDVYMAMIGLEELPEQSAAAVPFLIKEAIQAAKRTDVSNGPHPRLANLIETLRAITRYSDNGSEGFYQQLASLGATDDALIIASAAEPNSALAKDNFVKLQPLWRFALSRSDSQITGPGLGNERSTARLNLAKMTALVFSSLPINEMILALNRTSDRFVKDQLLDQIFSVAEAQVDLAKLDPERLNLSQKTFVWSQFPTKFREQLKEARKEFEIESHPCAVNGKNFHLALRTPKSEQDSEDTSLWLGANGVERSIVGSWNLQQTPFKFLKSKLPGPCGKVLVFVQNSTLVIPLLGDDRPFGHKLNFAFLDLGSMRIQGTLSSPAQFSESERVYKSAHDIHFNAAIQPSDSITQKDVVIRGRKADLIEDAVLTITYRLKRTQNAWRIETDLDRTWKNFPFKSYFKTQQDFVSAFDLNGRTIYWIRIAKDSKGPFCIYPSRSRYLPGDESKWRCLR